MTDRVGGPTPVVSVIVPVWNVEPWLRQCLDSVVEQTIGVENLELIAVDDGSTDGSGAILDEYAARHPSVIVRHEPNSGGPGRPRNLGLVTALEGQAAVVARLVRLARTGAARARRELGI